MDRPNFTRSLPTTPPKASGARIEPAAWSPNCAAMPWSPRSTTLASTGSRKTAWKQCGPPSAAAVSTFQPLSTCQNHSHN